jgi:hypothetical protein
VEREYEPTENYYLFCADTHDPALGEWCFLGELTVYQEDLVRDEFCLDLKDHCGAGKNSRWRISLWHALKLAGDWLPYEGEWLPWKLPVETDEEQLEQWQLAKEPLENLRAWQRAVSVDLTELPQPEKYLTRLNRYIKRQKLSKLSSEQRSILSKCIDIVNGIRTDDGYEDKNIENKYVSTKMGVDTAESVSRNTEGATGVDAKDSQILRKLESLEGKVDDMRSLTNEKPKQKKTRTRSKGGSKYDQILPTFFRALLLKLEKRHIEKAEEEDEDSTFDDFTLEKALSLTQKEVAKMLLKAYPDKFKKPVNDEDKDKITSSIASGIKEQKTEWAKWKSEVVRLCGDTLTLTDPVDFDKETGLIPNTQKKSIRPDLLDVVVLDYFGDVQIRRLNEGWSDEMYRQEAVKITPKNVAEWAKKNRKKYRSDTLLFDLLKWKISSIAVEIAKCIEWQDKEQSLGVTFYPEDRDGD